jgi:hypothetical protein
LLEALYADAMVHGVLERHGVPIAPLSGPAWQRFPVASRLTAELVTELNADCGLALHHIELLTGRPAATVATLLQAWVVAAGYRRDNPGLVADRALDLAWRRPAQGMPGDDPDLALVPVHNVTQDPVQGPWLPTRS